jgi:hypothetical protein
MPYDATTMQVLQPRSSSTSYSMPPSDAPYYPYAKAAGTAEMHSQATLPTELSLFGGDSLLLDSLHTPSSSYDPTFASL